MTTIAKTAAKLMNIARADVITDAHRADIGVAIEVLNRAHKLLFRASDVCDFLETMDQSVLPGAGATRTIKLRASVDAMER